VLPIDPELLRRQLDEQLRRNVELAYQDYLTKVRALETVVRAQGEIAAGWLPLLPLPLPALLLLPAAEPPAALAAPAPVPALPAAAAPAAPAPAGQADPTPAAQAAPAQPAAPPRAAQRPPKRPKAQDYSVYNAIIDALDQLGEVFDKNDLFRVLGFQPKKSNLSDALFELMKNKVIEVEWYGLGNKPTRYRRARSPAPEPPAGG
jgi:hypothetical protein